MSDRRYEGVIIDLDGTVYRGDRLINGAKTGIEALRATGIEHVFLTNNPIKRRRVYQERLASFGIDTSLDRVLTSATITAVFLAEQHPAKPVFVLGEPPLVDELLAAGVSVTADPTCAAIVVVSMDRTFDYADLQAALEAFENNPVFYATNPDRTCPVKGGEIPDAAGMIGAVEGVTGRSLDAVLGKPSPTAVSMAATRLGVPVERCLVIGDRLETDIRMGQEAGMDTALVLSGVTDRAAVASVSQEPTHVLESLGDVAEVVEQ